MTPDLAINLTDHRPPDSCDVCVSIDINAPADVVFDFLTVPHLAFRWMGIDGEISPEPGGAYRVRFTETDVAVGTYVDVRPHSRVSWSWGWEGSDEIPPGSSLVAFDLDDNDGITTVTVTHSGLPDVAAAEAHTQGWRYWGCRLALSSRGDDPDLVRWDATQAGE